MKLRYIACILLLLLAFTTSTSRASMAGAIDYLSGKILLRLNEEYVGAEGDTIVLTLLDKFLVRYGYPYVEVRALFPHARQS